MHIRIYSFLIEVQDVVLFSAFRHVKSLTRNGYKTFPLPILISVCTVFCVFSHQAGFVFAKPMREANYVTMLDPFHIKYGKVVAAGLSLTSVILDLIWMPATLIGLGTIYMNVLQIHTFRYV